MNTGAEPVAAAAGPKGDTVRLSPAQRQAAKYLAKCEAETVRVTVYGEADVTVLMGHRDAQAASGMAPKITHYLLAALARTLTAHPRFNAHFTDMTLTQFGSVNIAVAVAMENGDLVTPVLRDLETKSLHQISDECEAMVTRVRAGGMTLADTRDGGFTLSNLGRPKIARFATPVIPVPQVAILAATAIREAPVVAQGALKPAILLPLSLSFDHRAINGVSANAFLDTLGDFLAEPKLLEEPQPND